MIILMSEIKRPLEAAEDERANIQIPMITRNMKMDVGDCSSTSVLSIFPRTENIYYKDTKQK